MGLQQSVSDGLGVSSGSTSCRIWSSWGCDLAVHVLTDHGGGKVRLGEARRVCLGAKLPSSAAASHLSPKGECGPALVLLGGSLSGCPGNLWREIYSTAKQGSYPEEHAGTLANNVCRIFKDRNLLWQRHIAMNCSKSSPLLR